MLTSQSTSLEKVNWPMYIWVSVRTPSQPLHRVVILPQGRLWKSASVSMLQPAGSLNRTLGAASSSERFCRTVQFVHVTHADDIDCELAFRTGASSPAPADPHGGGHHFLHGRIAASPAP
ncbi:hypothetical protein PVAP13_5KG402521 [Panicum virgatum]|uniref:Uncharacterized protein n=1 Tax=Panicum virgatum TaxID=38727 RepID=A0A8T0SRA3_PANVG|nr:hypothetical protein PVAP13_5KG402521 [Panicum virgatum]